MTTPKALLRALEKRDGHVSAWTGNDCPELVPQHRQGGMGGGKSKHRLSNVVWLESDINGRIEADAVWQAEAVKRGIKISIHSNPAITPIQHAVHGLILMADDGSWEEFLEPERSEWAALARYGLPT